MTSVRLSWGGLNHFFTCKSLHHRFSSRVCSKESLCSQVWEIRCLSSPYGPGSRIGVFMSLWFGSSKFQVRSLVIKIYKGRQFRSESTFVGIYSGVYHVMPDLELPKQNRVGSGNFQTKCQKSQQNVTELNGHPVHHG